jgi:hypothetical protein
LVLLIIVGVVVAVGSKKSSNASPATTTAPNPVATTTTIPPTTTSSTSIASVDALINGLYYNVSQAYQVSTAAGNATAFNSDYPGSVNPALYQSCQASRSGNYRESEVPILSTLQLDPTWPHPGPVASQPYWVAPSAPVPGTTYELQVTVTDAAGTSTNLVHVTILNGKAYFYEGPIC